VPAVAAGVRGKVSCGLRENVLTVAEGSNASEQLRVYTFPDTPAQFSYTLHINSLIQLLANFFITAQFSIR